MRTSDSRRSSRRTPAARPRRVTKVAPELNGRVEELAPGPVDSSLDVVGIWATDHLPDSAQSAYWVERDHRILIGFDPWSVARAAGYVQPDDEAIADMLYASALPSSPTVSLLAGVHRWTGAPLPPAPRGDQTLEQGAAAVDHALRSAMVRVCGTEQRACVLVTGGLDSAIVAGLVADVTGRPPLLVAIRSGLSSERELRAQDLLAQHLGAEFITIDTLPSFKIGPLLRRNMSSDFPSGGVFTHIWDHAASVARAAGADLIFTGEGGNEVFGASLSAARDQLRSGAIGASLASLGRLRDTEGPGPLAQLTRRSEGGQRKTAEALANEWRGRHGGSRRAAERRRTEQLRLMRRAGYSFTEIDNQISLERADLFNAHTTAAPVPFFAPLEDERVVAAAHSVRPALQNPVNVGVQDKHLLRLVGRRYLPAEITELRKVGLSNQVAVAVRDADVGAELDQLERGAAWAGLRLTETFRDPIRLPADVGLSWTRTLAIAAWATQGLAG